MRPNISELAGLSQNLLTYLHISPHLFTYLLIYIYTNLPYLCINIVYRTYLLTYLLTCLMYLYLWSFLSCHGIDKYITYFFL